MSSIEKYLENPLRGPDRQVLSPGLKRAPAREGPAELPLELAISLTDDLNSTAVPPKTPSNGK